MTEKRLIFKLEAQNAQYLKKLEQSEAKIKSLESTANKSIGAIERQFSKSSTGAKKFGKAANDASARLGVAGRKAGQLGIQLSQLTGQIKGGQNAMIAISQQSQDIGFIFGPAGALGGAIVSIVAALGGSLIPELLGVVDTTKDLEKALESVEMRFKINSDGALVLSDRIKTLAAVSKEAAETELSIALIQSEIAIAKATQGITKSVDDLSGSLIKAIDGMDKTGRAGKSAELAFKRIRKELGLTGKQAIAFADVSEKALKDPTIENITEFYELANSLNLSNEKLQDFYTLVGTNLNVIKQSEDGIKKLKDAIKDVDAAISSQGDIKKTVTIKNTDLENQEAFKKLQESYTSEEQLLAESYANRQIIIEEALKRGNATLEEANNASLMSHEEYVKAMAALDQSRLSGLSGFFGQQAQILANGLGEGNALAKAAFLAQQALAIPQMIVATELGAAQALALGPIIGPPLAAAVKALGYASVGVVAGQTIASFEGGGFTGQGPRSGGMDGHGGMLAMVHPNEVVTDLTKASNDSGWKVEVNNYGSSNVQSEVDSRNKIVRVMIDELGNQNSQARAALHGTSNVQPRGRR